VLVEMGELDISHRCRALCRQHLIRSRNRCRVSTSPSSPGGLENLGHAVSAPVLPEVLRDLPQRGQPSRPKAKVTRSR
jgi:hypothetical protein